HPPRQLIPRQFPPERGPFFGRGPTPNRKTNQQIASPVKKRIQIRSEQGQSMTEFALVLPVLALILFAVLQFGIALNNYVTLTDAARAGARRAAVSSQDPDRDTAGITPGTNSAHHIT